MRRFAAIARHAQDVAQDASHRLGSAQGCRHSGATFFLLSDDGELEELANPPGPAHKPRNPYHFSVVYNVGNNEPWM